MIGRHVLSKSASTINSFWIFEWNTMFLVPAPAPTTHCEFSDGTQLVLDSRIGHHALSERIGSYGLFWVLGWDTFILIQHSGRLIFQFFKSALIFIRVGIHYFSHCRRHSHHWLIADDTVEIFTTDERSGLGNGIQKSHQDRICNW